MKVRHYGSQSLWKSVTMEVSHYGSQTLACKYWLHIKLPYHGQFVYILWYNHETRKQKVFSKELKRVLVINGQSYSTSRKAKGNRSGMRSCNWWGWGCVTSCTRLHNYVACVEVFDPSLWASTIFVMKFEVIVHFIGTAFPIELFPCMFHFIFLSKSFAKCKHLVQEIALNR